MTRFEPAGVRTGRAVRGEQPVGYSRQGTGRSIEDVRGRGREALAATRGTGALALAPSAPVRRANRRAEAERFDDVKAYEDTPVEHPTPVERAAPPVAAAAVAPARPVRQRSAPVETGPKIAVVPPLPVSAPRAPFVTLVLFMVVLGVLGILVINTKINEGAFHLHDLRAQQDSLDRQQQRLEREIAERESPGNLAAAGRQLGLVPARSPAFLRLPDGRLLGVPRPATGTPSVAGQANAGTAGQTPTR